MGNRLQESDIEVKQLARERYFRDLRKAHKQLIILYIKKCNECEKLRQSPESVV